MNKRSSALFESIVIALCGNTVFIERAMTAMVLDTEPVDPMIRTAERLTVSAQRIVERVESIEAEAK